MTNAHLSLQTNGMRVLSLLPGLLDKIVGGNVQQLIQYSTLPEDLGELTRSDGPARVKAEYGFGMRGVGRVAFHHTLIEHAKENGIPIVFGHQLVSFEETADSVTVTFANGKSDTGSFLVGCDGLHSNTRECLFAKQEPTFTGLVQVRAHAARKIRTVLTYIRRPGASQRPQRSCSRLLLRSTYTATGRT